MRRREIINGAKGARERQMEEERKKEREVKERKETEEEMRGKEDKKKGERSNCFLRYGETPS